jgi:hypothetical protein
VSEEQQRIAQSTNVNRAEAESEVSQPPPTANRNQSPYKRLEVIQAEVADAAALRSKMIEAMRKRLEGKASEERAVSGYVLPKGAPQSSEPLQAADETEPDSIFAPEPVPARHSALGHQQPPQPDTGLQVWDDAFRSAERVEKALARLHEALARDERISSRGRHGKNGKQAVQRLRPMRVAILFTASFAIGMSAIVLLHDWYSRTPIEQRLSSLLQEVWPAEMSAVASNEAPLRAVKSQEKPLAAPVAQHNPKTLAVVRLEVSDVDGVADAEIPLTVRALGASSTNLRVIGLPREAKLSSGRRQADGSWLLKPKEQKLIKLKTPPGLSGMLRLTVEAVEPKSGDLAAPPQEIRVTIAPAPAAARETVVSGIIPAINITPAPKQESVPVQQATVEPPSNEQQLAAIEEVVEAPAMAVGIDDPSRALIARGDALMELGDVVSARSFYDRAFEMGNTRAARSIARTYDPVVLASMKVKGLRADAAKAMEWYRTAEQAGEPEAAPAIAALENFLER